MEFIHTKCGGRIDRKSRTCLKCKKHWNIFSWWFNLTEIRPLYTPRRKKLPERKVHTGILPKLPGDTWFTDKLPKWPRKYRILVTCLILTALIVAYVMLVRR